jgi:hypothetical protein
MKINLIPTKKLALLSAAFCAAMLAFSHNASAVTVLFFDDLHTMGNARIEAVVLPSDADKTTLVNHLIAQQGGTTNFVTVGGATWTSQRHNNFDTLPGPAVIGSSGTSTNITIGSGIYSYLFATYQFAAAPFAGERVTNQLWYVGDLSGDVTIPGTGAIEGMTLIGWTLFGTGVPGVPDGGTTAMLLGTALGALGMARRFLKA